MGMAMPNRMAIDTKNMDTTQHILAINELMGNPVAHLDGIQKFLAPHVGFMTDAWIAIWCTTSLYLLWIAFVRKQRLHEQ